MSVENGNSFETGRALACKVLVISCFKMLRLITKSGCITNCSFVELRLLKKMFLKFILSLLNDERAFLVSLNLDGWGADCVGEEDGYIFWFLFFFSFLWFLILLFIYSWQETLSTHCDGIVWLNSAYVWAY